MPLITRGPIVPTGQVGSTAAPGLMRFHLHLGTSALEAEEGSHVAVFGSVMASPLAQRAAPMPEPQPGQRVSIRATWYQPGEGEIGETVGRTVTDQAGLFGIAVAVRGVPVDYRAVVDGPEGQPPLATSEPIRVRPR